MSQDTRRYGRAVGTSISPVPNVEEVSSVTLVDCMGQGMTHEGLGLRLRKEAQGPKAMARPAEGPRLEAFQFLLPVGRLRHWVWLELVGNGHVAPEMGHGGQEAADR